MRTRGVIGYHIILTAYGFWLPNDERGSGSDAVRAFHLRHFGPATKALADGENSVAARTFDREKRRLARSHLKHPPVRFTGRQARVVARGFAEVCRRREIVTVACAVMWDHAHLVVLRPNVEAVERLVPTLKAQATAFLRRAGLHPFAVGNMTRDKAPKVFAGGGRHRYVDSPEYLRRAVRYVERNPTAMGLPPQCWSFVRPIPACYL